MKKVYVFNMALNGLGVARALGMRGIKVVGLDNNRLIASRFSKYVYEFKVVTTPLVSERKFIEDLIALGKKEDQKPLLLPTNDVWAIAISKYKSILEKYFISYAPDYQIVDKIINKKVFYETMLRNSVRIPKTYNVKSYQDVVALKDQFEYPIVMKPNDRMNTNRSDEETGIYNKFRMVSIERYDDFEAYKGIIEKYDFLFQQKIPGLSNSMFSVGVYADERSDVIAVFSGRKVRGYPLEHGDCFAGESMWVEDLIVTAKKIIKILQFTGIAEVEFKKNEIDNEYYLIEVNPRTWSWIGITPYAGVNLPLIAFEHMVNAKKIYKEMDRKKKVLWVRMIDDRYNCCHNHEGVDNPDFPSSIDDWVKYNGNYDEVVFAEKTRGDYLPLYAYYLINFLKIVNRIVKKYNSLYFSSNAAVSG